MTRTKLDPDDPTQFNAAIYKLQNTNLISINIKTRGSELWGQERAKRIAKNKTRVELMCVFYTSKHFRNMTS